MEIRVLLWHASNVFIRCSSLRLAASETETISHRCMLNSASVVIGSIPIVRAAAPAGTALIMITTSFMNRAWHGRRG